MTWNESMECVTNSTLLRRIPVLRQHEYFLRPSSPPSSPVTLTCESIPELWPRNAHGPSCTSVFVSYLLRGR